MSMAAAENIESTAIAPSPQQQGRRTPIKHAVAAAQFPTQQSLAASQFSAQQTVAPSQFSAQQTVAPSQLPAQQALAASQPPTIRVEGGQNVNIHLQVPCCHCRHSCCCSNGCGFFQNIPCCFYHATKGTKRIFGGHEVGRRPYPSLPPEPFMFSPCLTRRQRQIIKSLAQPEIEELKPEGAIDKLSVLSKEETFKERKESGSEIDSFEPQSLASEHEKLQQQQLQAYQELSLNGPRYPQTQPTITFPPSPQISTIDQSAYTQEVQEFQTKASAPQSKKSPMKSASISDRKAIIEKRRETTRVLLQREREGKPPLPSVKSPPFGSMSSASQATRLQQSSNSFVEEKQYQPAEQQRYQAYTESIVDHASLLKPEVSPLQPPLTSPALQPRTLSLPPQHQEPTAERAVIGTTSTYHTVAPITQKTVATTFQNGSQSLEYRLEDRWKGFIKRSDCCVCGFLCRCPGSSYR